MEEETDYLEPLAEYVWQNKIDNSNVLIAILQVKIVESKSNLRGFAIVKYGEVTLKEIKLVQGREGMFLSFPSKSYISSKGEKTFADFIYMPRQVKNFIEAKTLLEYQKITKTQTKED